MVRTLRDMSKDKDDYKEIFKSTFLFAFVRVFQMLIGIIRNKLVAVILGPSGIGILQIYEKTTELIKKGAGLGISQSALRDISVAKSTGEEKKFSDTYTAVRRVNIFTGCLGIIITIILSPCLSRWTCGDNSHTVAYICLSSLVFFNIVSEIQLSILKGVRFQRALAYASIIGSICGLFISVPIYFIWNESGIVPAMIIQSVVNCIVTNFFVKKIKYVKYHQSLKESIMLASPMIKIGVVLVFVGVLDSLFAVILSSFLRSNGGFDTVGFYQAGHTLIHSYFGIIVTSLAMDYYPRVSAVNQDNNKVADEYNKQAQIGLLFILPLATIFIFFAPVIINLLYTSEFLHVIDFVDYAIIGAVFAVISECLRIILIAKQVAKLYATFSLVLKTCMLPVYMVLFYHKGLLGLGIAYMLDNIVQVVAYSIVNYRKYNIAISRDALILSFASIGSIILMRLIRNIVIIWLSYALASVFVITVILYTNYIFKKKLGMSIVGLLLKFSKIKNR